MKHRLLFTIALGLGLLLSPQPALAAGPNALILVETADIQAMDATARFIEAQGGQVLVTFAPHALLVQLNAVDPSTWLGQEGISAIHTGPVDADAIARQYDEQAGLAAVAWNSRFTPSPAAQGIGSAPPNDVLLPPDAPDPLTTASAPTSYQTSEYLYGSVQVDLFLPESNGSFDSSSETWSTTRRNQVVSEVTAGLTWWAATATQGGHPGANLSFNITTYDPFNAYSTVNTRYEPIRRPSSDDDLWIEEILGHLGYTGSAFSAARSFAHDRRTSLGRKWALLIFVADSANDSDGAFTDGRFGYAYLNGPYMVMTYDNDGWGINQMDIVTAHETAHIFGALDEYASSGCTPSQRGGYLNVANTNCENGVATQDSIMRSASSQQIAYSDHLASTPVRGMVGWRDSDGDGLYDPLDTTPSLSLSSVPPNLTTSRNLSYGGSTQDVPYDSPTHTDVTINTVNAVQYQVDGGAWQSCYAADGSLNSWQESFNCYPGGLADGAHTIRVRSRNSVNHYSTSAADTVTVDATPPTNPNAVNSGCGAANAVWQNSCNDPAFTWSGASDVTSGVSGYQYYWGTSATGTSTAWTSGATYNPGAAANGATYLRLRTKDQAGNWSSWQTLFTLKYDSGLPSAQLTAPAANSYLTTASVPLQATLSDTLSGPASAQFFVWYDDGSGADWHYIGSDANGSDGWGVTWNSAGIADQTNLAAWVYAWDAAGNLSQHSLDNITLDRTPPNTHVTALPTTLGSNTFIINWSGSDALAGLASYDIQYRAGSSGIWTDSWTDVSPDVTGGWFTGQLGQTYYFRARGQDAAGNVESYPLNGDTSVYLQPCSGDAYEPDSNYLQARTRPVDGATQRHTFCGVGDEDWLKFTATAGAQYTIQTGNLPYWTDTYLYLYDQNGQTVLAQNDDIEYGVNVASRLEWTAPTNGVYYLKIRDWSTTTAGSAVTYDIWIIEELQNRVFLPVIIKTGGLTAGLPPAAAPPEVPPAKSRGLLSSSPLETAPVTPPHTAAQPLPPPIPRR
ncbi:MAG: hypothetical protein Kow0031_02780 [Anaerolineae bacterium]